MTSLPELWIRHETRVTERRAPLVPADAQRLIERGIKVTVEESDQRIFPIEDYVAAGCVSAAAGSWAEAPRSCLVVGVKELPDRPWPLVHRHVYFGHAYKGQTGSSELLERFSAGGGTLLDLEYLVDADGGRLAAFGYWAGYSGAALAVLHTYGQLAAPLRPTTRTMLDQALRTGQSSVTGRPPLRALVIGALGRCGRGAQDALEVAGAEVTCWDLAETRDLDRPRLLEHDILVNTALSTGPAEPFLTHADLNSPGRRLALVADITCDADAPGNMLPIYDRPTTWDDPVRRIPTEAAALDLIAIDNLPSLLPHEANVQFSDQLVGQLAGLVNQAAGSVDGWRRSEDAFRGALRAAELPQPAHV